MKKCASCNGQAQWAWQPFGPDESQVGSFTSFGSHYRGFPVLAICDGCKDKAEAGQKLYATYKGSEFAVQQQAV